MLITVDSPALDVILSNRVRELCPLLDSLLPYSSLPNVHIIPFRLVLSYLNGDDALTQFTRYTHDTTLLLHFAQVWSLAARMVLPTMQNKLVSIMTEVCKDSLEGGETYPADDNLFNSFRHLHNTCGEDSHAEMFLISFVGRTTTSIAQLDMQLNRNGFDQDVQMCILAEARSHNRDPIEYTPRKFLVDASNPPRYEPLEVHPATVPGPSVVPLQVPEVRNHGVPRPTVATSHHNRTYQAILLSPLNISITTHDARDANSPRLAQMSGGAVSQPPLRIPNVEATAFANVRLGITHSTKRQQEEVRSATANAPNDNNQGKHPRIQTLQNLRSESRTAHLSNQATMRSHHHAHIHRLVRLRSSHPKHHYSTQRPNS
jgi:hypothetical protein